jgi:hypothetical protein
MAVCIRKVETSMTDHIFDPRPGWITDRTYELHESGMSYDD